MNRTSILEFASALNLGPVDRSSSAEWVQFKCPFAQWKHSSGSDKNASFGIHVTETEHSHYWCFSCHSKGEFATLAYELGQLRGQNYVAIGKEIERQELLGPRFVFRDWDEALGEQYEIAKKDKVSWPDPATEYRYLSAAGHPYLQGRGIDWFTAVSLGLRYDPYQRRILFPVYDYRGRFAGFSGRRVDRPSAYIGDRPTELDGSPYIKVRDYLGLRKHDFLLGEHRVRKQKNGRVTVVEGLFDFAFLTRLGIPNVVAVLGSHLTPPKLDKLRMFGMPVVLFCDNDKAGEDCITHAVDSLYGHVSLLTVRYPEGFEGADPASLPPNIIHTMYKEADLVLRSS